MKKLVLLFLLAGFGLAASAQADSTGKMGGKHHMKAKHKMRKHKHKVKAKAKGTTFNYSDQLYINSTAINRQTSKQKTA